MLPHHKNKQKESLSQRRVFLRDGELAGERNPLVTLLFFIATVPIVTLGNPKAVFLYDRLNNMV